jgi:DNA-binding PucR family transcriptional regulator
MYKGYLLVSPLEQLNLDELTTIQTLFSDILVNPKQYVESDKLVVLIREQGDVLFEELINSINTDLFLSLSLYESSFFDSELELKEDMQKKMLTLKFDRPYLNDKILFYDRVLGSIDEQSKKMILKQFYDDEEFLHSMKIFIEKNQNTSEAAKALYLHRNTLINRLDKFYRVTGFDLKKFEDAAIIYLLIKEN